ncbi:RNA polymerase sigma factor [Streptomyces sp. NPDC002577]
MTRKRAARQDADIARIRAVLVLGGVPWGDLDDGVQEVRLRLLERQAADRELVRDPATWCAVVASRVAVDWHRERVRADGLRARLAAQWDRSSSPHVEDDRVLALTVARGLDELTGVQRQVLTLRYYADLPVRDIARLLDVPEGTVKSRLHSATGALRDRLDEREKEDL